MVKVAVENTLDVFKKEIVMTVGALSKLLDCSVVTARRYLKRWNAYTSYNKNGRYYVLPEIPDFDSNGLWSIRDIRFSRYGNLKRTILHLIENSLEGLDASVISELIGFDSHSLLSRFEAASVLRREKHGGRFVYFSSEATVFKKQSERHRILPEKQTDLLDDAVAIILLVERIKHPRLDPSELTDRIRKQGLAVDLPDVRNFFLRYGLLKKNLDFRRFRL
ncbi:MAG: hypothetical protein GY866_10960 [Proteobacteria bacterium]|nr:hypothetical protein [Pseudomonadota bacterium]